jgi:hypothetical protein
MRASIVCSETGGPLSFEVKDDTQTVTQNWNRLVHVNCPQCGASHSVRYKEVYMDGVLSGFAADFEGILIGALAARP